jgi:hypothetical protein
MEPFKLRIKIGSHEFEAEGEQESVERQFALWRELIASSPAPQPDKLPSPPPEETPKAPAGDKAAEVVVPQAPVTDTAVYRKIFMADGPVVYLTVLPTGEQAEANAALLILLGQRDLLGQDMVTGGRVLQGLERSGMNVERADRVFSAHIPHNVLRVGQHRAVKYRMTHPGLSAATTLGKDLADMVP